MSQVSPFWSVMIPTYNSRPEFLEATLKSVLDQDSDRNIRIEVVDDCSPNISHYAVIQNVAGNCVKLHREPKNLGLAGIWNRCVERAHGEWVHILHHDDVVLPGFYSKMKQLISSCPTAGAAFCRNDYIDTRGFKFAEETALQKSAGLVPNAAETLAVKNQVQCAAIVVRKAAYEKTGVYDGRFQFTLDWQMWVRIASQFPILYHPELLASFRVQQGSETSRLTRTGESVRDSMRMIQSFSNYIPKERVETVQAKARKWTCDLALQKAEVFLENDQPLFALAQLHASLGYDKRWSSWKTACRCWLKSVLRGRKLFSPPLPFLPDSWFQSKT